MRSKPRVGAYVLETSSVLSVSRDAESSERSAFGLASRTALRSEDSASRLTKSASLLMMRQMDKRPRISSAQFFVDHPSLQVLTIAHAMSKAI
jgi:hypothetical protein